MAMYRIVFVCHGNICRSPAAEFIAKVEIRKRGLEGKVEVSSRAVSHEEIGNDIYPPMKSALRHAEIPFGVHRAAFLTTQEAFEANVVYYMDEGNLIRLRRFFGDHPKRFRPIMEYNPEFLEIEDPWYSGRFDLVVAQLKKCIGSIFDNLPI